MASVVSLLRHIITIMSYYINSTRVETMADPCREPVSPIGEKQADGSDWNVSRELKMVSLVSLGAIRLLTDKG